MSSKRRQRLPELSDLNVNELGLDPLGNLLAAVLRNGLQDAAGDLPAERKRAMAGTQRAAVRWVASAEFDEICNALGLEPDAVRRRLREAKG